MGILNVMGEPLNRLNGMGKGRTDRLRNKIPNAFQLIYFKLDTAQAEIKEATNQNISPLLGSLLCLNLVSHSKYAKKFTIPVKQYYFSTYLTKNNIIPLDVECFKIFKYCYFPDL